MPDVVRLELAARLMYSAFEYDRKFAAVKNVSGLIEVGLPNLSTRSFSEVTSVRTPTGPQRNTPAKAPTVVSTAGVVVVRSISEMLMPGLV